MTQARAKRADSPLGASMAIKRATAKDPAFRYSSAGAFVRAFSGEAADVVATMTQPMTSAVRRSGGTDARWLPLTASRSVPSIPPLRDQPGESAQK